MIFNYHKNKNMDKIDKLRKKIINTPGMKVDNVENVDQLIKEVAKECMRLIVDNEEFNGRGKNGWWSIREGFELEEEINKEGQDILLPGLRKTSQEDNQAFHEALNKNDIEGIKAGLRKFIALHQDGKSILLNLATMNQVETLQFFAEDEMINHHEYYKSNVAFEKIKGELFVEAYHYGSKNVIEYLIIKHHAETTPEAIERLSEERPEENDFKEEILNIIKKKHLHYFLSLETPNKSSKVNNKI